MSLQPCHLPVGQYEGTRVLRYKEDESTIKERTHKIIDRSCRFYGSSYVFKKRIPFELQVLAASPDFIHSFISHLFFPTHSDRKHKIHGLISIMFKVLNH